MENLTIITTLITILSFLSCKKASDGDMKNIAPVEFIFKKNTSYGELYEIENIDLYVTPNVSKNEAIKLGQHLVGQEFTSKDNRVSIQINKEGSTYEFRLVIKKGNDQDPEVIKIFKEISKDLSKNVFENNPVDVHLCDEYFETIRVIVNIDSN